MKYREGQLKKSSSLEAQGDLLTYSQLNILHLITNLFLLFFFCFYFNKILKNISFDLSTKQLIKKNSHRVRCNIDLLSFC